MQVLSKLKQRDIALIAIFVTVLLIIIWYFSFYSPVRAEIDTKKTQLTDLQTQVASAQAIARQVPQLTKAVAELKIQQEEFSRSLPKTQEIGNLLRDLQGNLAASGSEILSVNQIPGIAVNLPPGVQAIGIDMNLRSTFDSLFQSLQALEGMQRYSNVDKLTISLQGDPESLDPRLSSTMNMTVYTFDPAAASTAPLQPGATPATPGAAPAAPATPAPAPSGGRS